MEYIKDKNNFEFNFCLDDNQFAYAYNNKQYLINSSYNQRINVLISLFALKQEVSENLIIDIQFYNKDNRESFYFQNQPSNWFVFLSHLINLVGVII